MRAALAISWICSALAVAACGNSTGPDSAQGKLAADLDLAGADQPANLATHEDAAKAAVALVNVVNAMVLVFGELGDAVGDLVPDEDNPCPGGGSADGDLGGSFNHPRVRMHFYQCVRGDYTLDGAATIVCDDFDGSRCHRGQATVGEDGALLFFASPQQHVLLRGSADIAADEAARSLHAVTQLEGELRSATGPGRYGFVTHALALDLQQISDEVTEARIDGVAAIGGSGAAAANCISGRYDSETPAEPLHVESGAIRAGQLLFHSPPPRPGVQQAGALYLSDGAEMRGADNGQRQYSAEELADFCVL